MSEDSLHDDLTESEMAMIDAVRTLYDLVIGKRLISREDADRLLELHQRRWVKQTKPRAAGILGVLRAVATHPDVYKRRESALKLRMELPKGSA